MSKSFKILFIMHMRWARHIGAPRVSFELAEEFRALGHAVDKFDIEDALGPQKGKLAGYFHETLFARKAIEHVRRHGAKYDVIQAEHGNLPIARRKLNFRGLLVARTNGLAHFYNDYERKMQEEDRRAGVRRGTIAGNAMRWIAARAGGGMPYVNRSFAAADLIILSNSDELEFVNNKLGLGHKTHLAPNGLSEARFAEFEAAAVPAAARLAKQTVAFVGGWGRRKGSAEFPQIVRGVRETLPRANFLLLGTGYGPDELLPQFAAEDRQAIRIVPSFDPAKLPSLLGSAAIGLFPSYIEGFPSGVLEMLAAGLPTVGYDVPGTRDMLRQMNEPMLVTPGDVAATANRLTDLLRRTPDNYLHLSQCARTTAAGFCWKDIAREMLDAFEQKLGTLRRTHETNLMTPLSQVGSD
ncbi:MAG TPA: glycosyltransferase family 4 protein [Humisphaera sp.]|jgi:glycosyltransferase involved in cell wall biosynthesis|nr:glycosyltransferase family 4 protein [Humisphaera sp.]